MTELADWLTLLRAPGIGPVRFHALLARFGSPAAVLGAGRGAWEQAGLAAQTQDWLAAPDCAAIGRDLAWAAQSPRRLLLWTDPDYPPLLRAIEAPPPLLFVHGDVEALGWPALAIVGSRKPTPAGRETARDFARHLAASGFGVVSGLALGIDAEAHRGALEAEGRTVAVFGTGLDRVYPAVNRELAHTIVAGGGALVSELPTRTPVLAENFPRRNRILAGLALGTLVVEAALKSGSLITARFAAEQGREVFAIPGSIHNPMARGCHALIRDGAKLVETAADILAELAPRARAALEGVADTPAAAPNRPEDLDEDYRKLLQTLGDAPVSVDSLVQRSGLTAESVSSMLLILELRGYVAALPGGLYTRLGPTWGGG